MAELRRGGSTKTAFADAGLYLAWACIHSTVVRRDMFKIFIFYCFYGVSYKLHEHGGLNWDKASSVKPQKQVLIFLGKNYLYIYIKKKTCSSFFVNCFALIIIKKKKIQVPPHLSKKIWKEYEDVERGMWILTMNSMALRRACTFIRL